MPAARNDARNYYELAAHRRRSAARYFNILYRQLSSIHITAPSPLPKNGRRLAGRSLKMSGRLPSPHLISSAPLRFESASPPADVAVCFLAATICRRQIYLPTATQHISRVAFARQRRRQIAAGATAISQGGQPKLHIRDITLKSSERRQEGLTSMTPLRFTPALSGRFQASPSLYATWRPREHRIPASSPRDKRCGRPMPARPIPASFYALDFLLAAASLFSGITNTVIVPAYTRWAARQGARSRGRLRHQNKEARLSETDASSTVATWLPAIGAAAHSYELMLRAASGRPRRS